MFRIEDQNKLVRPSEVQYLFSPGINQKDEEDVVDGKVKKVKKVKKIEVEEEVEEEAEEEVEEDVTTFFFPSIMFPSPVQLISVTLLYAKSGKKDKTIHFCTELEKINEPKAVEGYSLLHLAHKRITTVVFDKPYYIEAEKPFYFVCPGGEKLEDAGLTIAIKHVNINYGLK